MGFILWLSHIGGAPTQHRIVLYEHPIVPGRHGGGLQQAPSGIKPRRIKNDIKYLPAVGAHGIH